MITSPLRNHYQRACAYLGSLHACITALQNCGVDEPWSSAMHADVARLARSIQAAVNDAERRTDTPPRGWSAPARPARSAPDIWAGHDATTGSTTHRRPVGGQRPPLE